MAVNIGPRIGVDGEAEYRRQLNNIIQQAKTLSSEMRAVTSAFDANDKSQEAVSAQTAVLVKQIELQKQRIEQLKKGVEDATKQFGEADSRTQKWKQAVNDATTDLNNMTSQLSGLESGIDDVSDAMDEAGNGSITFGEVFKANFLSQVIVNGVKQLASTIKDMAGDFIDSAASIKAETSQFQQTFGEFGDQATAAIGRVADSSNILDTRLNTVATQIYAFAKASGGDATESMELMATALQVVADGAAYYDKSLEDTAESLQSFLKGNYENDAALGLSATETTRNAKAMELFGTKFNDLSEIQKQQTLLEMVVDAQELSGAMGQAAREADGWENVQGNLNESWRQFMAAAGEPFLEQLVPIVQDLTSYLTEMTKNVDWDAFAETVTGFVTTIKDNGDSIITLVSGIGGAFVGWNVAAMVKGVVDAVNAFKAANEGATVAQIALNIAQAANPVGLIVAGIAAIVAAVVAFIATNEDARKAVTEAFKKIGDALSGFVDGAVKFFTKTIPDAFNTTINFIKNNWQSILGLITSPFDNAFNLLYSSFSWFQGVLSGIIESVKTAFWNMGRSIWDTCADIGRSIWSGIQEAVSYITSLPGQAVGWGVDFIQGFVNGIWSMVGSVVSAVSNIASTITAWLHFSRPDVGPLRQYETWMPDMMHGMAKGIRENSWQLEDALNAATSNMQANVNMASIPATSGRVYGGSINITVNASAGMDENALAEKVALKIQAITQQKEAIW